MAVTTTIQTLKNITATTVGQPINVSNARRVTIALQAQNVSGGNCVFSVEVSPNYISGPRANPADTPVWITCNKLIDNVANTNVQNVTRVASKTLSTNTTTYLTLDLQGGDAFEAIRVTGTVTATGTFNAWVNIVDFAFK